MQITRTYDLFGNVIGKLCAKCRLPLSAEHFNKRSELKDSLSAWCRRCHSERNKETYIQKNREESLVRYYGLTQEQWDVLFESQGRVCAACGSDVPGNTRGWHTDHIHGTKIVRGILCMGCNLAVGHLKDSPERADALARYLRKQEYGHYPEVIRLC